MLHSQLGLAAVLICYESFCRLPPLSVIKQEALKYKKISCSIRFLHSYPYQKQHSNLLLAEGCSFFLFAMRPRGVAEEIVVWRLEQMHPLNSTELFFNVNKSYKKIQQMASYSQPCMLSHIFTLYFVSSCLFFHTSVQTFTRNRLNCSPGGKNSLFLYCAGLCST